jgi:hypothetical protein
MLWFLVIMENDLRNEAIMALAGTAVSIARAYRAYMPLRKPALPWT